MPPIVSVFEQSWEVLYEAPCLLYLSIRSLRALSMFNRWPTRVTPKSMRSSFWRLGRWVPSISLSEKAFLCSSRLRLSSHSATSRLLQHRTGLLLKGLSDAVWNSVRKDADGLLTELQPCSAFTMGGVGMLNSWVNVGEVAVPGIQDSGKDKDWGDRFLAVVDDIVLQHVISAALTAPSLKSEGKGKHLTHV